MRPLWQLCLLELLRNVIIYCIMPVAKSSELFMFHSFEIMVSWIVQLGLYTSLFSVVSRGEMLDTHVNMYNVYSVRPAVTNLRYSRREMVSIRNAISPRDKTLPALLYDQLRHNGIARPPRRCRGCDWRNQTCPSGHEQSPLSNLTDNQQLPLLSCACGTAHM